MKNNLKIAFFGTPYFAVQILEELKKGDILPSLIVTAPDKPKGRKMVLTSPEVKIWAEKNNVEVFQPEKLRENAQKKLETENFDLFVVASYGKIIPKSILDIPKHGTLNIHPSLLPKFRGPSPIQSVILNGEKETGVSIMLLDEKMDHGAILVQEKIILNETVSFQELEKKSIEVGGKLLLGIIPSWVMGKIKAVPQNHGEATYTKMIEKKDGLIELGNNDLENWRKFNAFNPWPGIFFFVKTEGKELRVKITEAEFQEQKFVVKKVIPEGKKGMHYKDFTRGLK